MKIELKNILAGEYYKADFSIICELIKDVSNSIVDAFRDNNFNLINEEYNSAINLLSRVADIENQRKSVDYVIGRYIGIIEMAGEILLRNKQKEKVYKFIGNLKVEDIPHLNDIIITVAEHPRINHQKLADKIGITKGTLTPIMDKLVESGLITFTRPGKFKYYNLTSQGDEYYKDKLINIYRVKNKEALFEDLMLFVESSKNPSECVGEINKILYEKQFKSSQFKEKNSKPVDSFYTLNQLTKEQPIYISIENKIKYCEVDEIQTVEILTGNKKSRHILFSNSKSKNITQDENIFSYEQNYCKAN